MAYVYICDVAEIRGAYELRGWRSFPLTASVYFGLSVVGAECRADTPRNIRIQWTRWIFLAPDGSISERPARKAESQTLYSEEIFGFWADWDIFICILEIRRD